MQLTPNIIKFPTLEKKEATKTYFLQQKGFPEIIGVFIKFIPYIY